MSAVPHSDPLTLETARAFEEWDIDWIWYESQSKNPNSRGQGWDRLARPSLNEAERVFRSGEYNIGAHLRRNLSDVDADWIEMARALMYAPLRWRLPDTTSWGRQGKPRSHLLYFLAEERKAKTWKDPSIRGKHCKLCEFRVKGQTVAPGSLWKSDVDEHQERVRFERDGERPPAMADGDVIIAKLDRTAAVALVARYWREGDRQDTAGPVAGLLFHGGMLESDAEEFVRWVCAVANDDEVEKRIGYVHSSYQRGGQNQTVTGGPTLIADDCFTEAQIRKLKLWLGLKATTNSSADLLGPDLLPLTGNGDGDRFTLMWSDEVLYNASADTWYTWDGRRFQKDEVNEIRERAKLTVTEFRRVLGERQGQCGRDGVANYRDCSRHAAEMDAPGAITSMLNAAKSKKEIRVAPEDLDSHPEYLNLLDGTLELNYTNGTVGFHEHRPEDRNTWLAPVNYTPGASHRLFTQFLERFFKEEDRRLFLQEFFGSAIHGQPKRHGLQLIGEHDTGKSTTLKLAKAMLGDYAASLTSSNIIRNPHKGGDVGRPDLMRVKDKRLVIVTEVERGAMLDVPLIKAILSGGDPYALRTFFDKSGGGDVVFKFTLWMSGNQPYGPPPDDPASLERFEVLDCTHLVPENARNSADELALITDQGVLDAAFAFAVEGFKRLYGEKHGEFVAPKSSVARKRKLVEELGGWSDVLDELFVFTGTKDAKTDGVLKLEALERAKSVRQELDSKWRFTPRDRQLFEDAMVGRGAILPYRSDSVLGNKLAWRGVEWDPNVRFVTRPDSA